MTVAEPYNYSSKIEHKYDRVQIADLEKSLHSTQFRIKYQNEIVQLNDICHFRAEIIDDPNVEVYLECNLIFEDFQQVTQLKII